MIRPNRIIPCIALVALTIGCDIPPRPPLAPAKDKRANQDRLGLDSSTDTSDRIGPDVGQFTGDWEAWNAYYIRGNKIGFSHLVAESGDRGPTGESGSITYTLEDQLQVRRGKSVVVQHLTQTSTESADGRLIDFEAEMRIGPVNNQYRGQIIQDNLALETVRGSTQSMNELEWKSGTRGPVAIEQSLRRRPMQRGDVRKFPMLMPGRYELADVTLSCGGKAAIPMLDGDPRELTEINVQLTVADKVSVEWIIWTNEEGHTVKSYTPALQLVAFRTDKKTAMEGAIKPQDLITATGVDVKGELKRPLKAKRVAFQIMPSTLVRNSGDAVDISPAPDQYIRQLPDGSHQILISRVVENVQKGFVASRLDWVDDDLKPSALVDYKAPLVKRMADAAVSGNDLVDRDVAVDMTRTVKNLISINNLSHGLKKASEIAQGGEADCNGQAVLLTALLRAKDIPARVAAGLVYRPASETGGKPRMVYHMWTIAYVEGRWLALDATLGRPAPPDRITLITTNLSGGDEYKALAPILSVIGQIEIKVVNAQY